MWIGFTKDKLGTCNNDLQLRKKKHSEKQSLSRAASYQFKNNPDHKAICTERRRQRCNDTTLIENNGVTLNGLQPCTGATPLF